MKVDEKELERRLKFHERRMKDLQYPHYWRERSEGMYWHYLELLTKPERDSEAS